VLLILLLTLMSFVLVISGEQLDDDDLPFFEIGNIPWFEGYLFPGSLLLGFEMGVTITIMRLEYLNSRIGEKRPSDRRVTFPMASRLFRTTQSPLGSVVFLFLLFARAVNSPGSVFVRGRPHDLVQEIFLFVWEGSQGGL